MGEMRRVTRYLHGETDSLSDLWDYEAPQQDVYHYVLYETRIDLDVDMATGKAVIVAVNGVEMPEPIPA